MVSNQLPTPNNQLPVGEPMCRIFLTAAALWGVLSFATMAGCSSRSSKPPQAQTGGAQGSKPDKARKQAEALALNVVNSVAKSQAKADPELAKNNKGGLGGLITFITPNRITELKSGSSNTSTSSSQKNSPQPEMIAAKDQPQPKSSPRPGSPAIIRERVVSSIPYPTDPEAEDDVLNVAQNTIEQRLAELDPPVKYRPSLNEVKSEFIRKDSRSTRHLTEE